MARTQIAGKQTIQTALSTTVTLSASNVGNFVAIPGLAATITITNPNSKVLVKVSVNEYNSNNFPAYFHIYRDGVKITPNGPNTGRTPNNRYAGASPSTQATSTVTFEYLDNPGVGTFTYQIYTAKATIATSQVVINGEGTADYTGGTSTITLQEV